MFEFPNDKSSYEDIESKIMFGEAFLVCAFNTVNESEKIFKLPNDNLNEYPSGKIVSNYEEEEGKKVEGKTINLSGKLDMLHVFLRGGFIVPYQNTFDKYILNSLKLRDEKMNLIININPYKQCKGIFFFDNDEPNVIGEKKYYKVTLRHLGQRLYFFTDKNSLDKYNYNDHILGKIELWRADQVFELDEGDKKKKKVSYDLKLTYRQELNRKKEHIKGTYDNINNKAIFEISREDYNISIFDIDEIRFY
jgi:hypothetical protein